jgi:hypothetical protein
MWGRLARDLLKSLYMIAPRMKWLEPLVRLGLVTILAVCAGCNAPAPRESAPSPKPTASIALVAAPVTPAPVAAAIAIPATKAAATAAAVAAAQKHVDESSLKVKRFVVAAGVKDREPLPSDEVLLADGSAIYAFAELANPAGGSENVRITFERKGGAERVGDVTLPVPGGVTRHRTWAFTHFIRAAGVWEAVLWSESGAELGRASFEVKASSASSGA